MWWLECEVLAVWGTGYCGGEAWWLECDAVWGTVDHGKGMVAGCEALAIWDIVDHGGRRGART